MLKTDKKENDNSYKDDLDKYNLEEWQKEEVRKGFQDPWSFEENDEEEENIDEDNFYYEDHRSE